MISFSGRTFTKVQLTLAKQKSLRQGCNDYVTGERLLSLHLCNVLNDLIGVATYSEAFAPLGRLPALGQLTINYFTTGRHRQVTPVKLGYHRLLF
ncbi:hypothetical protein RRG08_023142 [Elysia crispata]|uniref:Uncharacterized protein n=1 Tax=Elysia crispata TaxID=231223 RepID=A0AAE0XMR3_9GAST|nr:hypothetical protein RRG08_023142 [Elysia crispata]